MKVTFIVDGEIKIVYPPKIQLRAGIKFNDIKTDEEYTVIMVQATDKESMVILSKFQTK